MAWNDDPKVRSLAKWGQQNGYPVVVAIVVNTEGVGYVSYGKTKELCEVAQGVGDQILAAVEEGKIQP